MLDVKKKFKKTNLTKDVPPQIGQTGSQAKTDPLC